MKRCVALAALIWAALGAPEARAQDPGESTEAFGLARRLELSAGVSKRSSLLEGEALAPLQVRYGGLATGPVRLGGAYYFHPRGWGVVGEARWERFVLAGADLSGTSIEP